MVNEAMELRHLRIPGRCSKALNFMANGVLGVRTEWQRLCKRVMEAEVRNSDREVGSHGVPAKNAGNPNSFSTGRHTKYLPVKRHFA